MAATTAHPPPHRAASMLSWRRVKLLLVTGLVLSVLMLPTWQASYFVLIGRMLLAGLIVLLAFGVFEHWPSRLPRWLARWALQVAAVIFAVPVGVFAAYCLTTLGDQPSWWHDKARLSGFASMTVLGLLVVPWIAISALFRQISGETQRLSLAFELERSEFERNALDARLRLLHAQVEPHFLFNTLANVRELVDSGSAQASAVLGSLIAYLRAAVPRLHDPVSTLGQEVDLVQAYLQVMHMRMPDRLQFLLHVDEDARVLFCPPMMLLTLVENAVRHGIDPSEVGGRIEVRVRLRERRCVASVIDTGIGLKQQSSGAGTGLTNLRERLRLVFGDDAHFRLTALVPHGTCAEIEFPARAIPA